jgi:Xaa-Pro aminopeptidase
MIKDKERLKTLDTLMVNKKIDGLFFFYPENILLASGMLPAAPFTVCVVTNTGKVILLTPWWREKAVESQSWADEIIIFNWLRDIKGVNPVEEILKYLKKLISRLKIKTVGFDRSFVCRMPSYTPSSSFSYEILEKGLKGISTVTEDVTTDIQEVRRIKTAYELKKMKTANVVAKIAARAFYKHAIAGMREIDVAAKILEAVQAAAGTHGIKFTYCDPPQITSGVERTVMAHVLTCPATVRRLRKGDLAMLELGGCADGYWFDITRTLVVGGEVGSPHKEMAEAINMASKSAYDSYACGQRNAAVIAEIASKVLSDCGFAKGIVHGLGHGVGFAYHESFPAIAVGSSDRIRPGMVTSVEPGIYLSGIGGMRIEENVVWQENSVKILSSFHHDLGAWQE